MKHLVMFYDKYKTIPHLKLFNNEAEMQNFIQRKTTAGIDCYEYNLNNKYSVEQKVVKSTSF